MQPHYRNYTAFQPSSQYLEQWLPSESNDLITMEEIYQEFLETETYTATADTNETASPAGTVLGSNSHWNWYT